MKRKRNRMAAVLLSGVLCSAAFLGTMVYGAEKPQLTLHDFSGEREALEGFMLTGTFVDKAQTMQTDFVLEDGELFEKTGTPRQVKNKGIEVTIEEEAPSITGNGHHIVTGTELRFQKMLRKVSPQAVPQEKQADLLMLANRYGESVNGYFGQAEGTEVLGEVNGYYDEEFYGKGTAPETIQGVPLFRTEGRLPAV